MTAMHDAAEDVAAQLVDAEGMREARRRQWRPGTHLRIAIGRPERSRHRDNEVDEQDDCADAEAHRRLPQHCDRIPAAAGACSVIAMA